MGDILRCNAIVDAQMGFWLRANKMRSCFKKQLLKQHSFDEERKKVVPGMP